MIIKAYAKINLTLDITGILPNGFHALRSVMAPISLCDEIIVEKSESFAFDCNVKSICTDDNLCVRAARAFFQKSGIKDEVSIYLNKHIPFPAGLGGGSSDAAAVLKGLNEFFGAPLDKVTLFELAEGLGSDVSLCLLGKPALCEGRGEILTPVSCVPALPLVIAIGDSRLSTPAVYKEYDKANLPPSSDSENFLSALKEGDTAKVISSCGNAFEAVVDILCPETKLLREKMLELGAINSHLSGSGPSVYGIFENQVHAHMVAEELQSLGYSAYVCETL